jgi:hypothetical protein
MIWRDPDIRAARRCGYAVSEYRRAGRAAARQGDFATMTRHKLSAEQHARTARRHLDRYARRQWWTLNQGTALTWICLLLVWLALF